MHSYFGYKKIYQMKNAHFSGSFFKNDNAYAISTIITGTGPYVVVETIIKNLT